MIFLSSEQKAKIDAILDEAVASQVIPALFFGVATADGPIHTHQSGNKLFDDPSSPPIDKDTVFWLCSQTKLIVALAGLKLIEQGRIALDTPVEEVLPELANPVVVTAHDDAGKISATTPAVRKITFGQLLNHSSGLDYTLDGTTPASGMPAAYSHSYKDQDVSDFFRILKGPLPGVPLKFEPGTSFAYGFSNDCAGFIVERLSGKSLEEYFKEYIFAPLGITSASFYPTQELKERLLPLTYRSKTGILERWNKPSIVEMNPAHIRVHLGGVGLYASQQDYLTILQHLLQIQTGTASNAILSLSSVNSLFEATLSPAGADALSLMTGFPSGIAQFGRGLCVTTADLPGMRKKGSGMWGGWANTAFFVDPTSRVAVVFATQLAPTGDQKFQGLFAQLEKEVYSGLSNRL
ncbi:beta-lactamase/transpeptidase-like protein [Mycena amicta]|nr:beta-lactamase/transpeptidase-like protein [Mycena amicta]